MEEIAYGGETGKVEVGTTSTFCNIDIFKIFAYYKQINMSIQNWNEISSTAMGRFNRYIYY